MRIIAGRFKGKTIETPKGANTRPTSDRVRESLFNVLTHGHASVDFAGARILDLFAGSGALGLEALSRGASYALFIDNATAARAAIRRNVEALGLNGQTKIWRRDATNLGPAGTISPFDVIFCDPPYGQGLGEKALAAAVDGGWVAPGATAIQEDRAGIGIAWPAPFKRLDLRRYGGTGIAIAQREADPGARRGPDFKA